MYAIVTDNLTKKFGNLVAVNQVSLQVEQGEIFGLLGPNGAGKTTIIKMLSTLIPPTEGSASVWGHNILKDKDAVRHSIGMVFQDPAVDERLTGMENLDFHARMYGMKKDVRMKRIKEVFELVGLEDKADVFLKNYSGGMKRRLEIARGLMHYPHVLFLDEPTLGLDPQTRYHIWEYIKVLNTRENVSIVLTTHYMEEADALCSRIGIIDYGKILVVDTLLGRTVGGMTTALFQGFLFIAVAFFVGLKVENSTGFFLAPVFMVLIACSFVNLGLAIASMMRDMQGFSIVMNFIMVPIFLLSGAMFPVEQFPEWVRVLSYIDPLFYGVDGLRYCLIGMSKFSPWLDFSVLFLFCVFMVGLGTFLFSKADVD